MISLWLSSFIQIEALMVNDTGRGLKITALHMDGNVLLCLVKLYLTCLKKAAGVFSLQHVE